MLDNKIEINFSILDNLHNFEHYTYMTQMVIKSLFINSVNYASDNRFKIRTPKNAVFLGVCSLFNFPYLPVKIAVYDTYMTHI